MAVRRSRTRWLGWVLGLALVLLVLAVALLLSHPLWSDLLFAVTGEEALPAQVRGTLEWLGNITRRQPETEDYVPIANAGINPFGVNTFLQEEVEPEKRELAVKMIADAGFNWIRQEFPWEDIEITAKGDFWDHKWDQDAWEKYDHIVDLADQYDLEIIARLSNPPAWSRAQGNDAGPFAPPDDLGDYGDFVEAMVQRYRGRIRYFQIWNEPNIYPEWGEQPVSPEAYTELLKVGYTRVKEACPECVVISGALAQTIPLGPRDLNDFIFLQRMYDAGAGDYFDVLAMQGYGLWSGPTDRRMRPRVLNFSRPLYLREIMVNNGDAHKPIWLTEMNWNAPPADFPNKQFGYVTPEQQARYAVLALQRAQQEWPWLGLVNVWFFKRAADTEADQAMYYFRLVEPDFEPMPVYDALKTYAHSDEARVLYPGVYQEDHWALAYQGTWGAQHDAEAEIGPEGGEYRYTHDPRATLSLVFDGTELWLKPAPDQEGTVVYSLDGGAEETRSFSAGQPLRLTRGLSGGQHIVSIRPASGLLTVDSLTVRRQSGMAIWLAAAGAIVAVLFVGLLIWGVVSRRRRWYERSRAG
jgi:hypothetical protein